MHHCYHLVLVLSRSCCSSFCIFGGALAPLPSLESNYTKSMVRADLRRSALKPQSASCRKGKCLRVDCPIAHKQDMGRQQQSHSELLDSFCSLFFPPLSPPKRMRLPILLLSGSPYWLFPPRCWACRSSYETFP